MIRGAWTKLRAKTDNQHEAKGRWRTRPRHAGAEYSAPGPGTVRHRPGFDYRRLEKINSLLTSQVAAPLQQIQKIEASTRSSSRM